MKICRFGDDRIGVVVGDSVRDVSAVLATLPSFRWPIPLGDAFIRELDRLLPQIRDAAADAPSLRLADLVLRSPVANPSKIIGAPVNYRKHLEEVEHDLQLHRGNVIRPIQKIGVFLKAVSSLVGQGDGVRLRFPERRTDHEVELAVIIGRTADRVTAADALDYVAGYCVGLDMSIRGTEARSLRKSIDSYSVLGPYLVTASDIPDPGELDLQLIINGEVRQHSNTRELTLNVPQLIELASSYYTLYPGDVIFTGTPDGVGPVVPGDHLQATIQDIGTLDLIMGSAD